MKHPVDIHPIDLGLLFCSDPDLGDVVLKKGGKWGSELLSYKGSLYRQTIKEPKWKTKQRVKMLEQTLKVAKEQLSR